MVYCKIIILQNDIERQNVKKVNFVLSDEDWGDVSPMIGADKKYTTITAFMTDAARMLVKSRTRERRMRKA